MVRVLSEGRQSGAAPMGQALVARAETEWVIQGSEQVKFTVTKDVKATRREE